MKFLLPLALLAVLPGRVPTGDLVVTTSKKSEASQFAPASSSTEVKWIGADRMRVDDGDSVTIVRADLKKMYMIDTKAKTYSTIDLPLDMKKYIPAEYAGMMEQMMGGMGMNMGGPGGGMTVNTSQCITNDNPVPEGKDNDKNCKNTHTMKGHTVNFEVVCPKSRTTGEVTYKNESMKGTIHSTVKERGQEQVMTMDISGKYEGPCGKALKRDVSDKAKRGLRKGQTPDESNETAATEGEANAENKGSKMKNAFGTLKSLF